MSRTDKAPTPAPAGAPALRPGAGHRSRRRFGGADPACGFPARRADPAAAARSPG